MEECLSPSVCPSQLARVKSDRSSASAARAPRGPRAGLSAPSPLPRLHSHPPCRALRPRARLSQSRSPLRATTFSRRRLPPPMHRPRPAVHDVRCTRARPPAAFDPPARPPARPSGRLSIVASPAAVRTADSCCSAAAPAAIALLEAAALAPGGAERHRRRKPRARHQQQRLRRRGEGGGGDGARRGGEAVAMAFAHALANGAAHGPRSVVGGSRRVRKGSCGGGGGAAHGQVDAGEHGARAARGVLYGAARFFRENVRAFLRTLCVGVHRVPCALSVKRRSLLKRKKGVDS